MEEIRIVSKPDSVSYEDIHNLLYLAHENNRKNGLHIKTADMTGDELKAHVGAEGECYVALDGDRLVGVTAVRIVERNYHFAKGRVADQILIAVHPDYVGKHISSHLHNEVVQFCKKNGLTRIEIRTAEKNQKMQSIELRWGFSYVNFVHYSNLDHNTVVLMKWLDNKQRPSSVRLKTYYTLRKMYVKARYKAGKMKR